MKILLLFLVIFTCSCVPKSYKQSITKSNNDFYEQNALDSRRLEIEKYGLNPNQTLLDIGSENTFFTCEIARKFPTMKFVLLDIRSLQFFKGKFRDIDWIIANNENCDALVGRSEFVKSKKNSLPLKSNSFSQVLLRLTFHEITEPEAMVNEIYRVLKQDGKVIISDNEPSYPNEIDEGCKFKYIPEEVVKKYFKKFKYLTTEYIKAEDGKVEKYIVTFQK